MTKFNLKNIMTQAWSWFKDEDTYKSDIEWMSYDAKDKSFANCLKAAWAKEKEAVEESEKEAKEVETCEEVKAWDWACKKLGVSFDLTPSQKLANIQNIAKEMFGKTVWQMAMKSVRLQQTLEA